MAEIRKSLSTFFEIEKNSSLLESLWLEINLFFVKLFLNLWNRFKSKEVETLLKSFEN